MAKPSSASILAFVQRETRIQSVPDVPGLSLHLADDVTLLWHRVGEFLGDPDPALPYWAFTWSGGVAIARHLLGHPDEVGGKTVFDVGTGSGVCALVALRAGAGSVHALDVDPMSEAAVALNARAANVRIKFTRADILDDPPPAVDVILAGDVSYEETMAKRTMSWLRSAADAGSRVLIGDPGRGYLSSDLEPVATYEVHTSREIEKLEVTPATVFTIP